MCKVRLKINLPPLPEPDRKALESLLCNCFHFKYGFTSLSMKQVSYWEGLRPIGQIHH